MCRSLRWSLLRSWSSVAVSVAASVLSRRRRLLHRFVIGCHRRSLRRLSSLVAASVVAVGRRRRSSPSVVAVFVGATRSAACRGACRCHRWPTAPANIRRSHARTNALHKERHRKAHKKPAARQLRSCEVVRCRSSFRRRRRSSFVVRCRRRCCVAASSSLRVVVVRSLRSRPYVSQTAVS